MKRTQVAIDRESLLRVLRDLNTIVVSLDRIGSAASGLTKEEYHRISSEFLDNWDVFQKLSQARAILSDPFSREEGPDLMDELEREMEDVPYWSWTRQVP
jgi:hypothetical protein